MHRRHSVFFSLCCWVVVLFAGVPGGHAEPRHHRQRPLVIAYFGGWGIYSNPPYYLRDLVRNGGARLLDQMNYAHASIAGGRCSLADPEAELKAVYGSRISVDGTNDDPASPFRGHLHQLRELKRRYPRLRILISLEGSAADFREAARPQRRHGFVASCVDLYLRGHFGPGIAEPGLFDGIDVDWEYPEREDAAGFRALLQEFRRQMEGVRPGLTLAIAVGDQPDMQPGTDFRSIAGLVDQVGVMNYDYAGPWNSTTGFVAPLFRRSDTPRHSSSIAESIASYERAGVPVGKMLMGLPFYGYHWESVGGANNGLFQKGRGVKEDEPYRVIQTLQRSYPVFRDLESRSPWLFDGANFWTFEDPISIAFKSSYAAHRGLGGIMIWELGEDTAEASLLSAACRSLRHPAPNAASFPAPGIPPAEGELAR